MRKVLTLIGLFLLLGSVSPISARSTETASSLLNLARKAYMNRADAAQAKVAVKLFAKAAKADPKSYEALWKGAKACYFYGNYTKEDASDKEKMIIFQDGINRAKAAVALNPDGVEGHFWLGVLYGVYGEAKGIFKSLSLVPDIKREMATCRKLDKTVEAYGPDRVLGRMFYKLPWFSGGSNKKAIVLLEASLKGAPKYDLTRLYLAEVYKSKGMKAKALAEVKYIVNNKPELRWAAEYPSIKRRAEKLLRKLT